MTDTKTTRDGTSADELSITRQDIESYLEGLIQTGTNPKNDPYTVYDASGKVVGHLDEKELDEALKRLGYSSTDIAKINKGGDSSSWLTSTLQGLAGGLAADPITSPAADGLSGLEDVLGLGTDSADTTATAGETATGGAADAAAGSAAGSALSKLATDAGVGAVLATLISDYGTRAIELILGVALLLMGIHALTGVGPSAGEIATAAVA